MFGGGGGGLNPRKMKQMMEQMGIDLTEIDAEEVVIRTADEELVFDDAQVQRMDAQGQATYQIVGSPESRPRSDADGSAGTDADADADAGDPAAEPDDSGGSAEADIPEADVEIVAGRTGASEDEARAALEATGGDLAAAVERLE
jgi:nascent polypeptide-associated complex subunit alpha